MPREQSMPHSNPFHRLLACATQSFGATQFAGVALRTILGGRLAARRALPMGADCGESYAMTRFKNREEESVVPATNDRRAVSLDPTGAPVPLVRTGIAGVLMGLANLVPGISGGTMVLVMGVYQRFVSAVADVTRFRIRRGHVIFLGVLVAFAGGAIVTLAGPVSRLVTTQREAMYSLFIGLTLGGVPVLWRLIRPIKSQAVAGAILGIGIMVGVRITATEKPQLTDEEKAKIVLEVNYGRDFAAGILGMSAMVLPGISGAHMLLILGRYEVILASISEAKTVVLSFGAEGDWRAVAAVLIPVAIGALLSLILLSNLIKWLLAHHPQPTLGFLLGILIGCVVAIWPFTSESVAADYALGAVPALAGFLATWGLSFIGRPDEGTS